MLVFQNADCDSLTTEHIDAFCFNDDDIDDLCDEGQMSRNYCTDCGSRNVRPLSMPNYKTLHKDLTCGWLTYRFEISHNYIIK